MPSYNRFDADLWRCVFNVEAMGTVTTNDLNDLILTGAFGTKGDYMGLYYQSEDKKTHDYFKYITDKDYTDCFLEFTPVYSGNVAHFNNVNLKPAITLLYEDGTEKYVTLGFWGQKNNAVATFVYDGTINLPNHWVDFYPLTLNWTLTKMVYNETTGEYEEKTTSGTGDFGIDYDMDFVNGLVYTTSDSSIPYGADCTLDYIYNTHESYKIDFNALFENEHRNTAISLPSANIERITLPIIPSYYIGGSKELIGDWDEFEFNLTNITVTNGYLNDMPTDMPKHVYRIAEGFDDEYDKNPKRLIEQMRALGYEKIINLYIGASHFYYKKGTAGELSNGYNSMVLDDAKGINKPFRVWLESFIKHMKLNGFNELICSISMENLQMPQEWMQLMYDGEPGQTGWEPPTNFYAPLNANVRTWVKLIANETLNIIEAEGLPVILQLGEPWFWWQEFIPGSYGDMSQEYPGQPPCFYDDDTKQRFLNDTGENLPIYNTSDAFKNYNDGAVWQKLNEYLGDYSLFMQSIAGEYTGSQYTVLFFPPSVLDKARVPEMMQKVNTPFNVWDNNQLNFMQIEDYDWVIQKNPNHLKVYPFAWLELGYEYQRQHYFSGFVLLPENAQTEWPLIEKAAAGAVGRGFKEVFIWAGTQIRRDNWQPRANYYSSDCEDFKKVGFDQY